MKKIFTFALALFAMIGVAHAQGIVTTITLSNGTTLEYEADNIENITFGETPWESLGYCLYGEDIIGSALYPVGESGGYYCCQYYVEVQENTEQPGLYRLVNPYGPDAYPFYDDMCEDYELWKDTYIEIDATDPEAVFIKEQKMGVYNSYFGDFRIYSYASYCMDYGYPLDQVKAAGYCGTLKDGKITFPTKMLLVSFSNVDYASGYYYANNYDKFLLDLNDKSDKPGAKEAKGVKQMSVGGGDATIVLNDGLIVK